MDTGSSIGALQSGQGTIDDLAWRRCAGAEMAAAANVFPSKPMPGLYRSTRLIRLEEGRCGLRAARDTFSSSVGIIRFTVTAQKE